jgi:hypothetical protein
MGDNLKNADSNNYHQTPFEAREMLIRLGNGLLRSFLKGLYKHAENSGQAIPTEGPVWSSLEKVRHVNDRLGMLLDIEDTLIEESKGEPTPTSFTMDKKLKELSIDTYNDMNQHSIDQTGKPLPMQEFLQGLIMELWTDCMSVVMETDAKDIEGLREAAAEKLRAAGIEVPENPRGKKSEVGTKVDTENIESMLNDMGMQNEDIDSAVKKMFDNGVFDGEEDEE